MSELIQIVLFFLCLLGTFFFAGVETGFVSWNPLKVSHQAGQGDTAARWALYLMNHQDRVISAVLIGSNICVIGATLTFLDICEVVSRVFSVNINKLPSAESWILTPFMVLFCEMLPKSLFRIYSFQLTMRSIPLLLAVYYITLPITWSVSGITKLFKRDGTPQSQESFLIKVREEMVLIAGEGSRSGTLIESADRYVQGVLNLKDLLVANITISLEEFNKRCQTIRADAKVGDLKRITLLRDDLMVTDELRNQPFGIIQLIDIIGAADKNPVRRYVKSLYTLKSTNSTLAVFPDIMKSSFRFIRVENEESELVGMIDKEDLIRTVFGGVASDFSQE